MLTRSRCATDRAEPAIRSNFAPAVWTSHPPVPFVWRVGEAG